MNNFKVGQKVWHIEVRIKLNTKQKNGVFVEEHKIIGISKFRICIDSDWFTTFSIPKEGKRKERHESYLNEINSSIYTNNNILGDGITINLYSTIEPTKRTIQKMVANCCVKIDKEYGWLFSGAKEQLYGMINEFENKTK